MLEANESYDVLFNKSSRSAQWLDRTASTSKKKRRTSLQGAIWKQLICFNFEWRDQVHELDLNPYFWKNFVCCAAMQMPCCYFFIFIFFNFSYVFISYQSNFPLCLPQMLGYGDTLITSWFINTHPLHRYLCTLSNTSWWGWLQKYTSVLVFQALCKNKGLFSLWVSNIQGTRCFISIQIQMLKDPLKNTSTFDVMEINAEYIQSTYFFLSCV